MDDRELKAQLDSRAREAGFVGARVAPARVDAGRERLHRWLAAGMHGEMGWMADARRDRCDAGTVLPGAASVIVFAANYHPGKPPPRPGEPSCRVAAYALGEDYHLVLKERLAPIGEWLARERPGTVWRAITDSAPLLERAFAESAGWGFTGKNTMLLRPNGGSFFLLAEIVTTARIEPDPPVTGTCGNCTRCLDACPTGAFPGPFVLDARRCISYWTIERKTPLTPQELDRLDGWAFGCDVCQDVCPYNRNPAGGGAPPMEEFAEGRVVSRHEPLATFIGPRTNGEFGKRFARSPLLRAGRKRLARNARAAAGPADGEEPENR